MISCDLCRVYQLCRQGRGLNKSYEVCSDIVNILNMFLTFQLATCMQNSDSEQRVLSEGCGDGLVPVKVSVTTMTHKCTTTKNKKKTTTHVWLLATAFSDIKNKFNMDLTENY